jgi:hypothetical protein
MHHHWLWLASTLRTLHKIWRRTNSDHGMKQISAPRELTTGVFFAWRSAGIPPRSGKNPQGLSMRVMMNRWEYLPQVAAN